MRRADERNRDMEPAEVTVLVHRAAEGDPAAWNAIVDEYAGLLWSVVRGFRLNDAQAADAVQTTWLRLVEHIADLREPGHVAGWLKTTAQRVCLQRSEEHTSELQSRQYLVCRLLLEKKK